MKHKRHEGRNLCADLVLIGWKLEKGSKHREWGTLEDISACGACLMLENPIPDGTLVSLEFTSSECQARVKYCVPERDGYQLGVEFANGYRWSRRKFKPEHLVQFRLRPAPPTKH